MQYVVRPLPKQPLTKYSVVTVHSHLHAILLLFITAYLARLGLGVTKIALRWDEAMRLEETHKDGP